MSFVRIAPTNTYRSDQIDSQEYVDLGAAGLAKRVVLFDSNGNEISPIGSSGSLNDGRQTVTTAGTRVQLSAASVACTRVTITAETDNTDYIVVGGSTVVAALATRRGAPLGPGDSITLNVNNLNLVYIDSLIDTEGVTWVVE